MSTSALERMIEQVAANVPGDDAGRAARVAAHLQDFWTPAMLADLSAAVESGSVTLSPLASQALAEALGAA